MTETPAVDLALQEQIARLRKWDFRGHDPNDHSQREVVSEMLRLPMRRVKPP